MMMLIGSPNDADSRFYKYVDQNGVTHYVDSKAKIPKEYRKKLKTYDGRYDHLSPEEREKKIAEDRNQAENLRKEREAEIEVLRQQEKAAEEKEHLHQEKEEQTRKLEKKRADREAFLKNFETKVILHGIHVLVPCTLGYSGKEVETFLLLDTGCTVTSLHDDVAKKLRLKGERKIKTKIANGKIIKTKIAKLNYIKIGPYTVDDFYVSIIPYKGPKSRDQGLLGMNFLAGRDYKVDYVRGVIRWMP